jgi:glycosyltransferase involved in cell wall biosynthesis
MPVPVTVVIPTFNRAGLLREALESVAAQDPTRPAEVLVVDDCSAEDVSSVAVAHGARVVRHEVNRGEAAADNTGIREAANPWVAFLDSDDVWLPGCLHALWRGRGDHVLVSGRSVAFGEGPAVGRVGLPVSGGAQVLRSPADLVFPENVVASSGVMVRRDALERAGGFDTGLRDAVDLDLWLRVLEQGTGVVLPEVVVRYRVHTGQASHDRPRTVEAHEHVLLSYADRPWFSSAQVERWRAVVAWDDLRGAQRAGRPGAALRELAWLAAHPRRGAALVRLLALRRRQRRATA